jgi:hypothetical protein
MAAGCGVLLTDPGSSEVLPERADAEMTASGDGAADPDGGDGAATDGGTISASRTVFVTSLTWPGNFGGVMQADIMCAALAAQSQNPLVQGRRFLAWISDGSLSPSTRFVRGTGPYVRTDGVPVAVGYVDLADKSIAVPIDRDEKGNVVTGTTFVWTGTIEDGRSDPDTCDRWTGPLVTGTIGQTDESNGGWSNARPEACTTLAHLYCFEE